MAFDHMANQDFERAVFKGFWRKILTLLRGENNELLPFDEVRAQLPIRGQHDIGMQEVPIDKIVGSVGRYHDFDRAFLPIQTRTKDRWVNIDKAHYAQVTLPAVELFKIGEIYFVKDGNHRISVARDRGQVYIDAHVTEIDIPVVLTPDTKVDDLVLKKEYARFILDTDLTNTRPDANIQTTVSGQYQRLLEHIAVHRWYLGEQRGNEVAMPEAAVSWYDHVYLPLVQIIRDLNILKEFPGSSEADLYLWIMEYQGYLRQAYQEVDRGEASARAEAARELVDNYPQPAVRKLVEALNRSAWIDEIVLRQEHVAFMEQTHLNEIRPDAHVKTTLTGQYDVLREHIAVHRHYLGEQRQSEIPYTEAVASWYDNVYWPIVEIIREQHILRNFPDRTETDLYLWLIEHQRYLQETFGGEIPIEAAAEDYSQRTAKGDKQFKDKS